MKFLLLAAILLAAGIGAGYYFGYDHGFEEAARPPVISSFEECAAAGFPIMESYPERCAVPGGDTFTRLDDDNIEEEEAVFCSADAKECPDGSFVSRRPPDCQFAPCPDQAR